MSDSGSDSPPEWAEEERRSPVSCQRCKPAYRRVLRPGRHLGEHGRRTVEQRGDRPAPPDGIMATGDHQPVGFDPDLPSGEGAQPPSYVEIRDHSGPGVAGEHDETEPRHPGSRFTREHRNLAGTGDR